MASTMRVGGRVNVRMVRGAVERDSIHEGGSIVAKLGTLASLDEVAHFALVRFDDGDVQAIDPRGCDAGSYPVISVEVLS